MEVTLKQFFNIGDGRLSTNMDDVCKMLNYIFESDFMTHEITNAIEDLNNINPKWYSDGVIKLEFMKIVNGTDDFDELMKIIDTFHSDQTINIERIKLDELNMFKNNASKLK